MNADLILPAITAMAPVLIAVVGLWLSMIRRLARIEEQVCHTRNQIDIIGNEHKQLAERVRLQEIRCARQHGSDT